MDWIGELLMVIVGALAFFLGRKQGRTVHHEAIIDLVETYRENEKKICEHYRELDIHDLSDLERVLSGRASLHSEGEAVPPDEGDRR